MSKTGMEVSPKWNKWSGRVKRPTTPKDTTLADTGKTGKKKKETVHLSASKLRKADGPSRAARQVRL